MDDKAQTSLAGIAEPGGQDAEFPMFDQIDEVYFRMRMAEERSSASAATDPAVKRTHDLLAKFYEQKLAAVRGEVAAVDNSPGSTSQISSLAGVIAGVGCDNSGLG